MSDDENINPEEMPEEEERQQVEPSSGAQRAEQYGREKARPQEKPKETEGKKEPKKEKEAGKEKAPESKPSRLKRGADIARHPGSYAKGYALQKAGQVAGKALTKIGAQALTRVGLTAIASNPYVAIIVGIIILIIGLIFIIIIIIIILYALKGGFGQSAYMSAGPRDGINKPYYEEMEKLINDGKVVVSDKSPEPDKAEIPSEKEFLLAQKSHPDLKYVDLRILRTLIYLGNKHERINVGHIIYPYIYMNVSVETKDTKDEKFYKSISAHKEGKAADITEIDKVCKGCEEDSPTSSILGGGKCCDEKVNIQVAWQDDPIKADPADRGISRDQAISSVENLMGFPRGSIEGDNLESVINSTGRSELERYLKLEPGSLKGSTIEEVIKNLGAKKLNQQIGVPIDTVGATLNDFLLDAGQSKIEEILNLPDQGFKGDNLEQIAIHLGQVKAERELGLPEGTISKAQEMKKRADLKWENQSILEDSLKKSAQSLNLPDNTLIDLVNKSKNGQDTTEELKTIGAITLSRSFGFPQDVFKDIIASPNQNGLQIPFDEIIQNSFWTKISETEQSHSLPDGSLKNTLNALAKGGSPKDDLKIMASAVVGNHLNMNEKMAYDIATGKTSLDDALKSAGISRADLASELGLSENVAALIFNPQIQEGFYRAAMEQGKLALAIETNIPYDLIDNYMNGQINYSTLINSSGIDLAKLSQKWNLPENALGDLISGNPKKAFKSIGYNLMEKNFKISGSQIDGALGLIQNGDIKGAAQQFAKNAAFSAIESALGLPPGMTGNILAVIEDPSSLIQFGIQMWLGGGIVGGLLGGILGGGIFGGKCNTDCYRTVARNKVHQVVKELLEMPNYDQNPLADLVGLPDPGEMTPTQMIVWSYERDVLPFETGAETPSYQDVWHESPRSGYGLFATTDNNYLLNHIHVAF